MLEMLVEKIDQMHQSLEDFKDSDLSSLYCEQIYTAGSYSILVDPTRGPTKAELDNVVSALISNIAKLKDHLKVWCEKNNRPFEGDSILNSNLYAGIIHDLWNLDKHVELNKPPRCGFLPKIQNLQRSLVMCSGGNSGFASMRLNPETGQLEVRTGNGGSVSLVIRGDVVDPSGKRIGDICEIGGKAIELWEQAFFRAGVPFSYTKKSTA